jgi:hypothetical protein
MPPTYETMQGKLSVVSSQLLVARERGNELRKKAAQGLYLFIALSSLSSVGIEAEVAKSRGEEHR